MLRTRLAKLMEARARDLAEAPGGSTGLLIRCGSPALPVYKQARSLRLPPRRKWNTR